MSLIKTHAVARLGCLALSLMLIAIVPAKAETSPKIHSALVELTADLDHETKAWVFFNDKGFQSAEDKRVAIQDVARNYNLRAVKRRAQRSVKALRGEALFNETDLPVASAYVDAVAATGARVHVASSWVNAVSVYADRKQLEAIAQLPFVRKLQPVARSARIRPVPQPKADQAPQQAAEPVDKSTQSIDYGNSQSQLAQMNVIAMHDAGFTGQGVVIGILDSGFKLSHEAYNHPGHVLDVVAAWDFINNDGNVGIQAGDPSSQHDHGTKTLSCIGAYKPGSLVGGAYDASFILCKTEDTAGEYEAEEDNYVAGLEFIEANGGDMATASLGYIDWYTQADLDGLTAVTTIAVNIATANGLHCCNAAGNEYHDSNPATSSLIAPADAFQVITCGAVSSTGSIASFSSDGPTADGRVKPELLARGVSAAVVSSSVDTSYTTANGTSFATPLVASAVACVIQARPNWTVDRLRERLFETADYYVANGTYDPLYVRGYGIINAYAAFDSCVDAGELYLDKISYTCADTLTVTLNDCHLNLDNNVIDTVVLAVDSDTESGVEQITLQETSGSSAEFVGTIELGTVDAPGLLHIDHGDTITVTYIDADDGAGGANIVVTQTAPVDCVMPIAQPADLELARDDTLIIDLVAIDPDTEVLTYSIEALPAHGELYDIAADVVISSVPYTMAPGNQQVRYTPLAGYAGPDNLAFSADDGIFGSNIATVSLLVIAPPPVILTETLPPGSVGQPYGPVQLAAIDGQPDVGWSLVHDLEYIEVDLGTNGFVAGGVAQEINGDDVFREYTLPFAFPFYGQNYTEVRLWTNGFLNFGEMTGSAYANSATLLAENTRIAPLWDDLVTSGAGQDIFVEESVPGEVTIRWAASTYPAGHPVNVAVTLLEEGNMIFHYGPGNDPVTPTVGVSRGKDQDYTLSAYDGATSLDGVNSVLIRLPESLPDGLTLSADGVITGAAISAGNYTPTIRVSDSMGRNDTNAYALRIAEGLLGDADADGDVDLADYAAMQACFSGDGVVPAPECVVLDADGDGDVDLVDFASMHAGME